MTFPGGGGASFPAEKATLDELYRAVQLDRPDDVDRQAEDWQKLHTGLGVLVAAIDLHVSKVSGSSKSQGSDAYLAKLRGHRERFNEASNVADSNASMLRAVSGAMRDVDQRINEQYVTWQTARTTAAGLGADESELKKLDQEYDEQAQYTMWSVAGGAKLFADAVQTPTEPLPASDSYQSLTDPYGNGGHGSTAGAPGAPAGAAGPAATAGGAPHSVGAPGSPQLQGPGTIPPAPAPPAAGPPTAVPPGNAAPSPPLTPAPPPLGGARPPGPGAGPRPLPGTTPPRSGGLGPPRPPQSTVRPVIGSRPGTSGMAPTASRGPTTNGLSRPVIGSRPGAANPTGGAGARGAMPSGARPGTAGSSGSAGNAAGARAATAKPLIGRDGVVTNTRQPIRAVRARKPHFGGEGTNRSVISGVRQAFKPETGAPANRTTKNDEKPGGGYRPEGGDYEWTTNATTVRGVITGGDWSEVKHTPGAVADLRSPGGPAPADETPVVERLSQRTERSGVPDDAIWGPPDSVPGVIVSPRPNRYDANDW